jgi:hypothetical protein
MVGCPCHLTALLAGKASHELPIKLDDFLIDIYFYLDKSSKRQQTLNKFMDEFNITMKKVTKHVVTRWLSLGKSLARVIVQWDALEAFFESEAPAVRKRSRKPTDENEMPPAKKRKSNDPQNVQKTQHMATVETSNEAKGKKVADPRSLQKSQHMASEERHNEFDLASFMFKQKVQCH